MNEKKKITKTPELFMVELDFIEGYYFVCSLDERLPDVWSESDQIGDALDNYRDQLARLLDPDTVYQAGLVLTYTESAIKEMNNVRN